MPYPHDDEEDPTANECNYNFPQLVVAFLLGSVMVFLFNLKEVQTIRWCPLPGEVNVK